MLYDFHTHTFLSDGVLSPVELIRRAVSNGYTAIAVTDHAGLMGFDRVRNYDGSFSEWGNRDDTLIVQD